jgi:hypothetical protein
VGQLLNSRIGTAVAAALGAGIVLIFAFTGGDDDVAPAPAPQAAAAPEPLTAAELSQTSKSLGQPIYWAGEREGREYELTRAGTDRITVRYPDGVTVGTYRLDDPVAAVRRAASAPTAKLHELKRGGVAVSDSARPTNTYFAYSDAPYQVEVYDPVPRRALRLVLSGRVRPVP